MLKFILFLALALFLAIFQASLWSINLLVLALLLSGLFFNNQQQLLLALFSGLIFDLVTGQTFGLSSLGFMAVVLLAIVYQRKFSQRHPAFFAWIVFLSGILIRLIHGQLISWKPILVLTGLGTALFYLLSLKKEKLK